MRLDQSAGAHPFGSAALVGAPRAAMAALVMRDLPAVVALVREAL
jgi:hypothetical protein